MDPRRIEEIRRRLREGREVRVYQGKLLIDGVPADPSGGSTATPQTSPLATGVHVKPHEWGAGTTEEVQFYASASGEARVLKEQALLLREYPGFEIDISDDGTPYAHGCIGPTPELRNRYHVLLVIPPNYGRGTMPKVIVMDPELRPGAPHTFNDGSLCLDHSGAFTKGSRRKARSSRCSRGSACGSCSTKGGSRPACGGEGGQDDRAHHRAGARGNHKSSAPAAPSSAASPAITPTSLCATCESKTWLLGCAREAHLPKGFRIV